MLLYLLVDFDVNTYFLGRSAVNTLNASIGGGIFSFVFRYAKVNCSEEF